MSEEANSFSQAGKVVVNSVTIIADNFEPESVDVSDDIEISEEA